MANDHDLRELKARVSEEIHDDFLLSGKKLGFKTRTEYLTWVILKELYGVVPQLQITREPGGFQGRD
jgi:hypothetical protein